MALAFPSWLRIQPRFSGQTVEPPEVGFVVKHIAQGSVTSLDGDRIATVKIGSGVRSDSIFPSQVKFIFKIGNDDRGKALMTMPGGVQFDAHPNAKLGINANGKFYCIEQTWSQLRRNPGLNQGAHDLIREIIKTRPGVVILPGVDPRPRRTASLLVAGVTVLGMGAADYFLGYEGNATTAYQAAANAATKLYTSPSNACQPVERIFSETTISDWTGIFSRHYNINVSVKPTNDPTKVALEGDVYDAEIGGKPFHPFELNRKLLQGCVPIIGPQPGSIKDPVNPHAPLENPAVVKPRRLPVESHSHLKR